jgi:hypothetical protein
MEAHVIDFVSFDALMFLFQQYADAPRIVLVKTSRLEGAADVRFGS